MANKILGNISFLDIKIINSIFLLCQEAGAGQPTGGKQLGEAGERCWFRNLRNRSSKPNKFKHSSKVAENIYS